MGESQSNTEQVFLLGCVLSNLTETQNFTLQLRLFLLVLKWIQNIFFSPVEFTEPFGDAPSFSIWRVLSGSLPGSVLFHVNLIPGRAYCRVQYLKCSVLSPWAPIAKCHTAPRSWIGFVKSFWKTNLVWNNRRKINNSRLPLSRNKQSTQMLKVFYLIISRGCKPTVCWRVKQASILYWW